ncbi:hypothetical protein PF005_g3748 [Phytophthora fragariae]|uniref:Uncharacterized protein n=1 Tax=Phytophthora fragariae TaxID=53985 RepID=A0A6A3UP38_9STRA|nr:hypothetical protein PF003_g39044 [Phytophthora fragariae]KAE8947606.1 hypothetical protein PF009_g2808 [Phytophthora fragariae]KAE9024976.1 hypothetical protein PF011_g3252 [Phytophthora fragariae]KAE9131638.1 hypothetical protein PF010_g3457 [Phytophthora fragariae]KAE9132920.1 hypothetical protein PF007_g3541 [Phytophthora fragariae]
MKKEDFTIEKVESALRRIFQEKSKKAISLHMDRSASNPLNNVRANQSQKWKQGDGKEGRLCFYCFGTEHFKTDFPIMANDRSPDRAGGPLYRTDAKTAPGAKRAKRAKTTAINTIKTVVADGKKRLGRGGKTALEQAQDEELMDDVESLNPAPLRGRRQWLVGPDPH